jgi:hypothetical protein
MGTQQLLKVLNQADEISDQSGTTHASNILNQSSQSTGPSATLSTKPSAPQMRAVVEASNQAVPRINKQVRSL